MKTLPNSIVNQLVLDKGQHDTEKIINVILINTVLHDCSREF